MSNKGAQINITLPADKQWSCEMKNKKKYMYYVLCIMYYVLCIMYV